MKTLAKLLLSLILVAGLLTAAQANFAKPDDAIEYRQAVMTLLGNHFGRMAAVVKGQQPYDHDDFLKNATLVETFAKLPWEAFMAPGSDKGPTHLKPEAFEKRAEFEADAKKLEAETMKLAFAAHKSDLDGIKQAFWEVAKACQGCHKQFRVH